MALGTVTYAQEPAGAKPPRGQRANRQPGQPGQAGQRQERRGRLNLAAMPVETLDALVKLTPEQKTKFTAIHDKFLKDREALGGGRPGGQGPGGQQAQPGQPGQTRSAANPANREKLQEMGKAANDQALALLTDAQKEKLKGAGKDIALARSLRVPYPILAELKLTDAQKTKIADISREAQEKTRALSGEDRRTKGREIMTESRDKILALLDATQKATLEKNRAAGRRGGQNRRAEGNRPRP
jgi:Spy/CpxP family protein refolding chaperone